MFSYNPHFVALIVPRQNGFNLGQQVIVVLGDGVSFAAALGDADRDPVDEFEGLDGVCCVVRHAGFSLGDGHDQSGNNDGVAEHIGDGQIACGHGGALQ